MRVYMLVLSRTIAAVWLAAAGSGCTSGPPPEEACSPLHVKQVAAGSGHTCALLSDGRVKCWGWNSNGQLGLGDTENRGDDPGEMGSRLPAVDLGTGERAVEIAAGALHTCALLGGGRVKCWGDGEKGQLGLGDTDNRGAGPGEMGDDLPAVDLGTGRIAVHVTTGFLHTCALLDDATVKCWGINEAGILGLGDTRDRGDGPGEMGDDLPAVDLGAGQSVVDLAAGFAHTCAVLDDGRLKCWGYNRDGQLGLGDRRDRGDEPGEMGDNLPAVDLGSGKTAAQVATGEYATCAILDGGSVKCWGFNSAGDLGLGDANSRGGDPGEMGDNLPAVDLGAGKAAVQIAIYYDHTCAVLRGGSVKCWGIGGLLGLGDLVNRGDKPGDMGDNLPAVDLGSGKIAVRVAAGLTHTCALLEGGQLKCWGLNAFGVLGSHRAHGIEPDDMGDDLPAVNLF